MNMTKEIVLVLTAALVSVVASPLHAQTAAEALKPYVALKRPERQSDSCEGAQEERAWSFYGTLGVDASHPMLKIRQSHPYISIAIIVRARRHSQPSRERSPSRKTRSRYYRALRRPGRGSHSLGGFVDPYRSSESDSVRPEFIDPRHLLGTPITTWLSDSLTTKPSSKPEKCRRRIMICCYRAGKEQDVA